MHILDLARGGFHPRPVDNTAVHDLLPADPDAAGLDGAWVAVRPGQSSTPHRHHDRELLVVVGGTGVLRHGTESHPLRYGISVVIDPDVVHAVTNTGTSNLVMVSLHWPGTPDPPP